jgi:hypothetical protein
MDMFMSLFVAFLFVVLSPGVLLKIPRKGSPLMVAVVHGLVFGLVYYFTHELVSNAVYTEGFATRAQLQAQHDKHARAINKAYANIAIAETNLARPNLTPKQRTTAQRALDKANAELQKATVAQDAWAATNPKLSMNK